MTTPEGYIPALQVECGGLALRVSTHVVRTTSYDFLLGVNWLDAVGAKIRFNTKQLIFQKRGGTFGSISISCTPPL